jgi:hypothetical protein
MSIANQDIFTSLAISSFEARQNNIGHEYGFFQEEGELLIKSRHQAHDPVQS